MCGKDVRYTSIEQVRAAFYPHIAWWMDLDPNEIVEWPELEDEIMARHEERKRAQEARDERGDGRGQGAAVRPAGSDHAAETASAPAPPHASGFGPYTAADLHEQPEDGKGAELEDGWLVERAAGARHNWVAAALARLLEDAVSRAGSRAVVCSGGEWEIATPAGVRKPDVFACSREAARAAVIDEFPRLIPGTGLYLAAEVISPASASERADRVRKVTEYAALGIGQYWIVEHTPRLSVQILTLTRAAYAAGPVIAAGTAVEAVIDADKRVAISFDPAELLGFWNE